ncbi:MAG: VPLPA-CTERM sorting domain-containing protein [Pseudomonadota bacterium]
MSVIKFLAAAALTALVAAPGWAVTIMTDRDMPTYSGKLAAPTSNSANFRLNYQGSDLAPPAPNSRTPWEEFPMLADTGYYNSVERKGFAEYVYDNERTTFSLMWGSPDRYNWLRFYNADDQEVFAMNGHDSAIVGTPGYVAGRKYVNVSVSDLQAFTRVRLESYSDAFEYSGVAPVPLPAAGLLLMAGLGGLGAVARKRARTKAAQTA